MCVSPVLLEVVLILEMEFSLFNGISVKVSVIWLANVRIEWVEMVAEAVGFSLAKTMFVVEIKCVMVNRLTCQVLLSTLMSQKRASGFPGFEAQLPTLWMEVEGQHARALIDSGCSKTIVTNRLVRHRRREGNIDSVVMMNGGMVTCERVSSVQMEFNGMNLRTVCLVTTVVPGFDLLLGMDVIDQLVGGGVRISNGGRSVEFGKQLTVVAVAG